MADETHLAVLKQGADAWNAWRAAHSGTPADLANASLRGLDLAKANLAGADCRKADFRGTILSGATLTDANLAGANFFKSVLDAADLAGANPPPLLIASIPTAWKKFAHPLEERGSPGTRAIRCRAGFGNT